MSNTLYTINSEQKKKHMRILRNERLLNELSYLFVFQRGKIRDHARKSSPRCLRSYHPCCLCSKPSSQKSSTPATTAPCLTPRHASCPHSTGWVGSRSFLRSSGPSHYQVAIVLISCFVYNVQFLPPGFKSDLEILFIFAAA